HRRAITRPSFPKTSIKTLPFPPEFGGRGLGGPIPRHTFLT
ncbi:MAG: hypothetical protein QOF73_5080, partial [Thermomicrobiales bacterium]|nr:hypothetical protein [Thermomicrobiales bacterium]